ncbi:Wzz/FepE/Etk N-terminal domain-containing protein [Marinomonas posidonica]|uniref:Lipopolysaccharide biosynthesis protein n=1 Tax=Marinomonas posidonica (strain CECT 7376 / NCIMB 14433 / IVIA-Po-181) TaxID=491952 RepID=F6CZ43_MARPP|nr:Wzz/FepE/Etk N-terminal domain-containing protein [Marinomonas posidonica]AEF53499.1 lipopolysaccharide biosynthesis protein [Marinomonas posidonica IVIA-Po-181]
MSDQLFKEQQQELPTLGQYYSRQEDEIDLKELFLALWKGKWIIVLSTFLVTVLAIAYALSATQKWTAQAIVTVPQVSDFSQYQKMVNGFQPAFDIYQEDGAVLVSESLASLVDSEKLFSLYIQQFQSKSNKLDYIATLEAFKQDKALISSELSDEELERAEQLLYSKWSDKLDSSSQKDNSSIYTLNGTWENAEGSFSFLAGYLDYIDVKAKNVAISNLASIVNGKFNGLTQEKRLLEDQAKSRLKIELEQSRYALQIAKAAKLNAPVENLGDKDIFSINMGANALEAKVKVLERLEQLEILEPKIQIINSKLKLLNQLAVDPSIVFQTSRFIERPEKPLSRTSPKRPLIAILGTFLGGLLGCFIVLVRFAFREK